MRHVKYSLLLCCPSQAIPQHCRFEKSLAIPHPSNSPTSLVIGSVVTLFQPPSEEERGIALVSGLASLGEAFGGIGFPSSRGGEKSPSPTSAESAADFPAVCFASLKQTCQVRSFQAGEGLNKTRQFFRFQINASCCRQYKPSICEGWQPKGTRESWKCFLRQRQIRLRSDMEGQSQYPQLIFDSL